MWIFWTAWVRSRSTPDTSSGVRTAGTGATEDPGAGRSGATVVVVAGGDEVTGSRRDRLGGGEDMIEPKLADTKLLWRC